MRHWQLVTTLGLAACGPAPAVPPTYATPAAIERTVARDFYGAVEHFDSAAVRGVTTADLEVVEDTTRYSLAAFAASLAGYVGTGTISHQLDAFNTTIRGATAWTSYRDRGVFTPNGGGSPFPFERLETAVLVYEAGRWRVSRLHSHAITRP